MLKRFSTVILFTVFLAQACYAGTVDPEILYANDTRIQYNPPVTDTKTWITFPFNRSLNGILTVSDNATASLIFQGSSFSLNVNPSDFFAQMEVVLDGETSSIGHPTGTSARDTVAFMTSGLDPTATHTITIQKPANAPEGNAKKIWSIIFLSVDGTSGSSATPSRFSSLGTTVETSTPGPGETRSLKLSTSPLGTGSSTSLTSSSGMSSTKSTPRKRSGLAGVITGAIIGAFFLGTLIVVTVWRKLCRRREALVKGDQYHERRPRLMAGIRMFADRRRTGEFTCTPFLTSADCRGGQNDRHGNRKSVISAGKREVNRKTPILRLSTSLSSTVCESAPAEPYRSGDRTSLQSTFSSLTLFSETPFGDGRRSKYRDELV